SNPVGSCPASARRFATSIVQHSGVGVDSTTLQGNGNPASALGAPDGGDVNFDGRPGFVIVGFDPHITSFSTVRVHLVDFSARSVHAGAEDETFSVLVSADGTSFTSIGTRSPTTDRRGQRDAFDFPIPSALQGSVRFVQIRNQRVAATGSEGPDLDAIELV